jgi:DnaJ-class molecular chaperone
MKPGKARNLFENLDLLPSATEQCITKRVRHLRKILHPDWYNRNVSVSHAPIMNKVADKMRVVVDKTADILLNPTHRAIYLKLMRRGRLSLEHGGIKTPFPLIQSLISKSVE